MRLQSATEYMITYGWTFLILAVAVAVLYSLNVFNPSVYAGSECVFSSGFSCLSYTMNSMGWLTLNIQQSTQNPIFIRSANCTSGTSPGNTVVVNQYVDVGSNVVVKLQCYSSSGPFNSPVGGAFTGAVLLNYTDQLSRLPGVATGKLRVKVSTV